MVNEKFCGIVCVDIVIDVIVNNNIFFNFIDIENIENKLFEIIEFLFFM